MRLRWKYAKPLVDNISDYEKEIGYIFPDSFVDIIKKHNGGRPSKCEFIVSTQSFSHGHITGCTRCVMKSLLFFNKNDRESVWNCGSRKDDKYIAFAIDHFGNTICFDRTDDSIVFLNHELGFAEYAAADFIDFLNKLM